MEEKTSGQALKDDGLRLFREGLYDEAAAKFREAQEFFQAEEVGVEAAEMLNNLGVVHRMQGNWDDAIAAFVEAKGNFALLGDRSREAQTLGNLGGLYSSKGDREKSKECLQAAADLFGELGDTQRQGETLLALGVQSWKTGIMDHPTASQKVLRSLLGVRNRLLNKPRS